MIVISGALVLVALVLLLIGLLQPELAFIYASIAISLISFGFLIVGVRQRRGETFGDEAQIAPAGDADAPTAPRVLPLGAGSSDADERVAPEQDAAAPAVDPSAVTLVTAEPAPAAAPAERVESVVGTVLIVAGRPRYHVSGCRYLSGKSPDEVDIADAREKGFTACGVCKPDLALEKAGTVTQDVPADEPTAAPAPAPTPASVLVESDDTDAVGLASDADGSDAVAPVSTDLVGLADDSDDLDVDDQEVAPVAIKVVPAARRATRHAAPAAAPAPVEVVETPTEPAKPPIRRAAAKAPVKRPTPAEVVVAEVPTPAVAVKAAKAPAKAQATKTPARKATTASAAKAAAAAAGVAAPTRPPGGRGSVVVLPDRGKFHTSACRYVRGVDGAQVLSRTAATRSGYDACGVCKP